MYVVCTLPSCKCHTPSQEKEDEKLLELYPPLKVSAQKFTLEDAKKIEPGKVFKVEKPGALVGSPQMVVKKPEEPSCKHGKVECGDCCLRHLNCPVSPQVEKCEDCHKLSFVSENPIFKCSAHSRSPVQREEMKEYENYRERLKKQLSYSKMPGCVGCGITPEALDSLISHAKQEEEQKFRKILNSGRTMYEMGKKEERERIINRIKNMLLWSKGTVEGTRNDIIAKLSTTSDKDDEK